MKAFLIQCHSSVTTPVAVLPLEAGSIRCLEVIREHIDTTWCYIESSYRLVSEAVRDEVPDAEPYTVVRVVEASGYDNPNDVYSIRQVELIGF